MNGLSQDQVATLRSCMHFVVESGELKGEFDTRMGVTELQARQILQAWPPIDDLRDDSPTVVAINNALNEVCHGVQVPDWSRWFAVPLSEVKHTYQRWAASRGWKPGEDQR